MVAMDDSGTRAPSRLARRLGTGDAVVDRPRLDDRRGRVRGVRPRGARRGRRPAGRPRRRRAGGVLQRDLVGAAGRALPRIGRDLRLRARAPRRVLGVPGRAGGSWSASWRAARRWRSPSRPTPRPRWRARWRSSPSSRSPRSTTAACRRPSPLTQMIVARGAGVARAGVVAAVWLAGTPTPAGCRRWQPDGAAWRPAVGRAAVLRVRRLRPHGDAGRGGASIRTHDPARHPARAGRWRWSSTPPWGSASWPAAGAARSRRPSAPLADAVGPGGWPRWRPSSAWARRSRRWASLLSLIVGVSRRCSRWRPPRSAGRPRGGPPAPSGSPPRRADGRRRSWRSGRGRRHPVGDRFQLVRGPPLLRDHERRRADAGPESAPVAPWIRRSRIARLRRAGLHAPHGLGGRRRRDDVGRRGPLPGSPARDGQWLSRTGTLAGR